MGPKKASVFGSWLFERVESVVALISMTLMAMVTAVVPVAPRIRNTESKGYSIGCPLFFANR